jgi:hypothetical protein
VEDLLHERGIDFSHEEVRYWWHRFGPMFAAEIRRGSLFWSGAKTENQNHGNEQEKEMNSQNRTALVTGGVQGLGATASRALADADYIVAAAHLGGAETAKAFERETGLPVFEWDVGDFAACSEGAPQDAQRIPASYLS